MVAQQISDFSVMVQDIRQQTHDEQQVLTLIWLLQGEVVLESTGDIRTLQTGALAIVNPNQRWRMRSGQDNAVMTLTIASSWLTRLDAHFFAFDYQVPHSTMEHEGRLRSLMRQLLVTHLINHETPSRLEANRWLSEIALLLATHFQHAKRARRATTNQPGATASVRW